MPPLTAAYATVPRLAKLNGFSSESLVVNVMYRVAEPSEVCTNRTVNVSEPPATIEPLDEIDRNVVV